MPLELDAVNHLNVKHDCISAMILHPSVLVHGLADARAALALGKPLTLLSAPGAAGFAGCLWWQALVTEARAGAPETEVMDILDCADASGFAMAAIRSGVCRLVLWAEAPGHHAVAALAEREGGFVLRQAPAALDMAQPNAIRRLPGWLQMAASSDM
jgi:hypothetical protein